MTLSELLLDPANRGVEVAKLKERAYRAMVARKAFMDEANVMTDDERDQLIDQIRKLRKTMTFIAIAEALNRQGVRTVTGGRFTPGTARATYLARKSRER